MGTEIGVMSPQAKERQELGRAHGADSPSEPPEEPTPPTPGLRRPALSLRVPSRVGQAAAPLRRAVSLLCEVTCARAWSLEYQQWRGPLTLAVSSPMK